VLDIDEMIALKLVHEIHTSERKSFRACRRRWNWLFRENLYPTMTAKPLEFGTVMHLGYEVYYDPSTWNAPRDVVAQYAIKKAVEKSNEQRKAFLASGLPYNEEDVTTDYDERVALIKGMLNHYFKNIAPVQDVGWTPVKVEIAFMVAIPHPDTKEPMWCKCDTCWERWTKSGDTYEKLGLKCTCGTPGLNYEGPQRDCEVHGETWQGLPVVYAGRLDMLAVDNEGNYWIFDWKSARAINVDHDEFLELDDQIMSYVWALRKLGLPIKGFVYHEQKKGFPNPPAENKARRLGRLFSVSKNQDTDYDTYLKTIKEFDTAAYEEGLYDEFLDFLQKDGIIFYKRWQIHKTDYQCEQAEYNIGQEALEIIDPLLRIYPSPGRFGCTTCAFRQPCLEVNAGGDFQYALDTLYEKREHYYVRRDPSTESKGGE
jgi:hypothetical protein